MIKEHAEIIIIINYSFIYLYFNLIAMTTMLGKKKKRENQPEEGENGLHKVI